jgi:hypothetical protein
LPGNTWVILEFYRGTDFTGTFTGTCLLWSLQLIAFQQFRVGGEGRNRPYFPAVAPQICLISLRIQAKTVLSDPIVFNPFGVRFGVRLPTPDLCGWGSVRRALQPLLPFSRDLITL